MHSGKLVAAIKVGGKTLRERDGKVYLPFGSEYSIHLKNLDSLRIKLNVTIDGRSATPDKLILHAGQSVDLERFIKSLDKGNRFKFIERTEKIEKHRGIGAEDGLIRVEAWTEKPQPVVINTPVIHEYLPYYLYYQYRRRRWNDFDGWRWHNSDLTSLHASGSVTRCAQNTSNTVHVNNSSALSFTATETSCGAHSEEGITVDGSLSNQQFYNGTDFETLPYSTVIVLKLAGGEDKVKVVKPVVARKKVECSTCGTKNKSDANYCKECGTSLVKF